MTTTTTTTTTSEPTTLYTSTQYVEMLRTLRSHGASVCTACDKAIGGDTMLDSTEAAALLAIVRDGLRAAQRGAALIAAARAAGLVFHYETAGNDVRFMWSGATGKTTAAKVAEALGLTENQISRATTALTIAVVLNITGEAWIGYHVNCKMESAHHVRSLLSKVGAEAAKAALADVSGKAMQTALSIKPRERDEMTQEKKSAMEKREAEAERKATDAEAATKAAAERTEAAEAERKAAEAKATEAKAAEAKAKAEAAEAERKAKAEAEARAAAERKAAEAERKAAKAATVVTTEDTNRVQKGTVDRNNAIVQLFTSLVEEDLDAACKMLDKLTAIHTTAVMRMAAKAEATKAAKADMSAKAKANGKAKAAAKAERKATEAATEAAKATEAAALIEA